MFGWLKMRAKPRKKRGYPLPSELSDDALIRCLHGAFADSNPVVGALFLTATQNNSVWYSVFVKQMLGANEYAATIDGYIEFLLDAHSKHVTDSELDEVHRRRWFYLYLASLLNVANSRARKTAALWDSLAEVYVCLMPGARALRSTLDKTKLWSQEEIEWFAEGKDEDEGEKWVEALIIPPEIRYHAKLEAWRDRDLTPEQRAQIEQDLRILRDGPG